MNCGWGPISWVSAATEWMASGSRLVKWLRLGVVNIKQYMYFFNFIHTYAFHRSNTFHKTAEYDYTYRQIKNVRQNIK
jgi:hypothetical protein